MSIQSAEEGAKSVARTLWYHWIIALIMFGLIFLAGIIFVTQTLSPKWGKLKNVATPTEKPPVKQPGNVAPA